jgi:hypothetical protein
MFNSLQAVEKGPPASLRSIVSLQRIRTLEYWSDGKNLGGDGESVLSESRRIDFSAPRIWTFLNSLESSFFNNPVYKRLIHVNAMQ